MTFCQVSLAEQQVARSRVKKVYSSPTDPKWNNQWSLVSV